MEEPMYHAGEVQLSHQWCKLLHLASGSKKKLRKALPVAVKTRNAFLRPLIDLLSPSKVQGGQAQPPQGSNRHPVVWNMGHLPPAPLNYKVACATPHLLWWTMWMPLWLSDCATVLFMPCLFKFCLFNNYETFVL